MSASRAPVVSGDSLAAAASVCACASARAPRPSLSRTSPTPIAAASPSHWRTSFNARARLPCVPMRLSSSGWPRKRVRSSKSWRAEPRLMPMTVRVLLFIH